MPHPSSAEPQALPRTHLAILRSLLMARPCTSDALLAAADAFTAAAHQAPIDADTEARHWRRLASLLHDIAPAYADVPLPEPAAPVTHSLLPPGGIDAAALRIVAGHLTNGWPAIRPGPVERHAIGQWLYRVANTIEPTPQVAP